ncbi:MAG TPA: hypothetical protein VJT69_06825 [Pyrinomonadaceae bacterium]|nr:hypothetical protein [Pyrinomonadaceae bacterium]
MRKFALTFIGGLLIGAVATFIVLGQITFQYRDYYMNAAHEQVFIASELRAKREHELQNRIEAGLPEIVLTIHNNSQLRKSAGAPSVLRNIRDFYEVNALPIPSEISGILNDVPRNH